MGLVPVRLLIIIALVYDWRVLTSDVEQAYLQAPLRGKPKFLRLPRWLWPKAWKDDMKRPVVRLIKALYGLARAGFDWMKFARDRLTSVGWKEINAAENLYKKGTTILALYVDDLMFTGPDDEETLKNRREVFELFEMSEPEEANVFLGMKLAERVDDEGGRCRVIHQSKYAQLILSRFQEESTAKLKEYATPSTDELPRVVEGEDEPGVYKDSCARHVGGLMYLCRLTRPDLSFAVARVARHVHDWRKMQDQWLDRIFGYLQATTNYGIVMKVAKRGVDQTSLVCLSKGSDVEDGEQGQFNACCERAAEWKECQCAPVQDEPEEREQCKIEAQTDADHAGCISTGRSTSGWCTFLRHGDNMFLLDHGSKRQSVTARSTGESECVALADGVCRSSFLAAEIVDSVLQQVTTVDHYVDANACLQAVQRGFSKKMGYLRKHQRVNLGFLKDALTSQDEVNLRKIGTDDMTADVLTKSLPVSKFQKHRAGLGVGALPAWA